MFTTLLRKHIYTSEFCPTRITHYKKLIIIKDCLSFSSVYRKKLSALCTFAYIQHKLQLAGIS